MRTDCDRRWEIDAIREGTLGAKDVEAFQRHARACEVCTATIARDRRLRELAMSLMAGEPSDLAMRRLRARVLHEVATGAPARRLTSTSIAIGLVVALLTVASWAFVGSGSRARAPRGSTVSTSSPQPPPSRDLAANALAGTILDAGEASNAPSAKEPTTVREQIATPRDARSVSRMLVRSAPAIGSSPISTNSPADDGADAYAAAVALLRTGQYSPAASAFRAFLLAHPRAWQVEDASFLVAAALARAGRPDAAALAAEEHLERFPKSFHRKEAAILVARAARDRGDCAQARTVLAPWLASPQDEQARATLQRCAEQ